MKALYVLAFIAFIFDVTSSTLTCQSTDVCKCTIVEDKDNSTVGVINLKSVGNANVAAEDFQPRFTTDLVYSDDYAHSYVFKYNPCYGFDVDNVGTGLALTVEEDYGTATKDIGVQDTEKFQYDPSDDEFYIMYNSNDGNRSSIVSLECALVLDGHELTYSKLSDAGFYTFTLKGPCACPGFCDDNGIIEGATLPPDIVTSYPIPSAGCTQTDTCLCTMDDNSGVIDLRSLSKTDGNAMFLDQTSHTDWYYMFNPCSGFTYQDYSNLAVVQYSGYSGIYYDLGATSSEEFIYNPPFGIGLYYESAERDGEDFRNSTVYLSCDASVYTHTFRFLNEYSVEQYPFVLQGPCACPGLCDENGIIGYTPPAEETTPSPDEPTSPPETTVCEKQDSCKCQMADNSGSINLHSLSSSDTPRWSNIDGNDGYLYSYNPCSGWTSAQQAFTDLAVLQSSSTNVFEEYDLGVQTNQYFTSTDDGEVRLVYKAKDEERTSIIILVCERNEINHDLIFNGETIATHYEFTLIGPCACPGLCDDKGKISQPDDNTNNNNSEEEGYWFVVNAAIASLVLHDLILVAAIIIIVFVLKYFFNIQCCRRNPKYGNFT